MAGDWRATGPAEPLGWRLDVATRALLLTPAFARLLDVAEHPVLVALWRRIDPGEAPRGDGVDQAPFGDASGHGVRARSAGPRPDRAASAV